MPANWNGWAREGLGVKTCGDDYPPFWRVEERLTDPSEVFNEARVPETRLLVLLSTEERDVST
jgi:hypothetical protein